MMEVTEVGLLFASAFTPEGKRRALILEFIGRATGCHILSPALYSGFLLGFVLQLHVRWTVPLHILHSQYMLPRNRGFNAVTVSL